MKRSIILLVACLLIFGAAGIWSVKPLLAYRLQRLTAPSIGDSMISALQPRHTKLGLAGREKNWAYAAYELGELQESFDRLDRLLPRWNELAAAIHTNALMPRAMAHLSIAIKNADAADFAQAYGQLTDACNRCHQGAGLPMIVIQTPNASSFPDQDFHPMSSQ